MKPKKEKFFLWKHLCIDATLRLLRFWSTLKSIFSIKESLIKSLNKKIKSQVSRTKDKDSGPRNTRLYFEFLNKTQNIVSEYLKILELYSEKYDKKIEEK